MRPLATIWAATFLVNALLFAYIERIRKMSLTRAELDSKLASLPDTVTNAVVGVLTPVLKPYADRARAEAAEAGQDYSDEGAKLDALPGTLSTALASAVTDLFKPAEPNAAPADQTVQTG